MYRNSKAQFRVLTPTMYRSRMASTRQTLSMDYSSSVSTTWATNKPAEKLSLRAPVQNEDSLDLELGASATHVDRSRSSKVLEKFGARSNGKISIIFTHHDLINLHKSVEQAWMVRVHGQILFQYKRIKSASRPTHQSSFSAINIKLCFVPPKIVLTAMKMNHIINVHNNMKIH